MNTEFSINNCFIPVRAVGFTVVPAAPRTPETLELYYNHGVPSNEKDVMARIERMFIVENEGDSTITAAGQVDDSVTLVVDEQAQHSSSGSLHDFSLTKTGLLNGIHRLTVIHRNIKGTSIYSVLR